MTTNITTRLFTDDDWNKSVALIVKPTSAHITDCECFDISAEIDNFNLVNPNRQFIDGYLECIRLDIPSPDGLVVRDVLIDEEGSLKENLAFNVPITGAYIMGGGSGPIWGTAIILINSKLI